jgi:segregation and condensation protein B
MTLDAKIEALLFYKGEPVSMHTLANMLGTGEKEIENALTTLQEKLSDRGIALMRKEDEISLSTSKEMSETIDALRKEELNKDLSKASLETLAVVIYKNGATRSEIDYIRGVNSSFILRNLLVRGLVEKITDPEDQRRLIYKPTFELLSFMGVSNIENMPEFKEMQTILSDEIAADSKKEEEEEIN